MRSLHNIVRSCQCVPQGIFRSAALNHLGVKAEVDSCPVVVSWLPSPSRSRLLGSLFYPEHSLLLQMSEAIPSVHMLVVVIISIMFIVMEEINIE